MDDRAVFLSTLLERDHALCKSVAELRSYLRTRADFDKNPGRRLYTHMNHGPSHWDQVAENASVLWEATTSCHPGWATPEAAFLLLAASELHDVAMIIGFEHVHLGRHPGNAHIRRKFAACGFPDLRALDRRAASTPLGDYLLREFEQDVAVKVIDDLRAPSCPFDDVDSRILAQLKVIVGHYKHLGPKAAKAMRDVRRSPCSHNVLLAAMAVLFFADWAHLDNSRVDADTLKSARDLLSSLLACPSESLASPLGPDAEDYCEIPRLFRSHYVFGRSLAHISKGRDHKSPSLVRFCIRAALPPGLDKSRSDDAYVRLSEEWRSHLFPSRMHHPLADDYLWKHAEVELVYKEPVIERNPPADLGLMPVPPFVRDYWAASRWLNLDLAAQFLGSMERMTPRSDFLQSTVNLDTLFTEFSVELEHKPTDRPRLSRRVLIYLHAMLTRGHPILGDKFYRQLSHDLSVSPSAVEADDGTVRHVYRCALRAASYTRESLFEWCRTNCPLTFATLPDSRAWSVFAILGREYPAAARRQDVVRDAMRTGLTRTKADAVVSELVRAGACTREGRCLVVANTNPGAYAAISGAPFFPANATLEGCSDGR